MEKLKEEIALENIRRVFDIEELEHKTLNVKVLLNLYTDKEGSDWEYKIHYLSTYVANNYSLSTIKQYLTLFNNSKKIEEDFKKDIYDFSETEMKDFLKSLKAKTYNAITSKYSLLKNYIEVAKTNKKGKVPVPTGMLLKAVDLKELIFAYAQENRYCTRAEIENGIKKLDNPVDQVIFLLLFEGFMGKGYKEITTLRVDDIDLENRTIKRKDGKTTKISSFTAKVLEEAKNQTHYYRYNSTVETRLDLNSPYLVKTKLTSTSNGEELKHTGVTRRLDVLKDRMKLPLLTAKTIYISGLIERVLIYEHENNVKLKIAELKNLLREWGELREGADLYKAKEILEEQMLKELQEHKSDKYIKNKEILTTFKSYNDNLLEESFINIEFQQQIRASKSLSREERKEKLSLEPKKPEKIPCKGGFVFKRNPHVVAERLYIAGGYCEKCKKPAPFNRSSDGSPYLEIHHKVPLSKYGDDTVENTVALCPNCHRKIHFG